MIINFAAYFLVIVLIFSVILGFVYLFVRHDLGSSAAKRTIIEAIPFLGVLVVFVYIISFFWNWKDWEVKIWPISQLIGAALFLGNIALWPWRKKRAGEILLDIPAHKKISILVIITLLGVLVLYCLFTDVIEKNNLITELPMIILCFSILIYFFILKISRIKLTKKGILSVIYFLKWEKIISYRWEGKRGEVLSMVRKQFIPFFRTMSIPIPPKYKDSVNNVLREHLM